MKKGDYRVICDRSGFKVWASECIMEWNGLYVLKRFWDPKPEYLQVPNVQENLSVPIARTEGVDVFNTPNPDDL
jgi:hypothetical protein